MNRLTKTRLQELDSFVKEHPEYDTLSVSAIKPKRGSKKDRALVPVFLHEGQPQADAEQLFRTKRQKFFALAKVRDAAFNGVVISLRGT